MNWKQWKIGLLVAAFTGLITALVTNEIVPNITPKQLLLLLLVGAGKDILLFLKQHPAESVTPDNAAPPASKVGLFLLIGCLMFTGYGCQSPQKAAYVTLSTVGAAVDNGMKAAAKAKVEGKLSQENWQKIADKHAKFLVAYNTACDLAAQDYTQLAPQNLITIENDLLALIQQFVK